MQKLNPLSETGVFAASGKMGPGVTPVASSGEEKMFQSNGGPVNLPKHSYWVDLWVFLLFDIALFLFVYFIVP
uniref:Uncharacterized protein n=1 Tax=Xiphophorus couchianus TaxID=32473 RepID=A0A3B5KUY9_9TELE